MALTVYTLEQSEQWDAVVRSFKEYDVYWLSGYVKAFQIHGDGEPLVFFYEGDGCRGINVVMKRDVAKDARFKGKIEEGRYFDFSTPYGYGGWIAEGEKTEELFEEYRRWIQKNGIISELLKGVAINVEFLNRRDVHLSENGDKVAEGSLFDLGHVGSVRDRFNFSPFHGWLWHRNCRKSTRRLMGLENNSF